MKLSSVTSQWPVVAGGLTALACSLSVAASHPAPESPAPLPAVSRVAPAPWQQPAWTRGFVPCKQEDSLGSGPFGPCFWDARVRGNGHGRSFTVDWLDTQLFVQLDN